MIASIISGLEPWNPQIQKLTITPAIASPHILSLPVSFIAMFSPWPKRSTGRP